MAGDGTATPDPDMLKLLASAVRFHDDYTASGRQARAKLWRHVDGPSPTGKISASDAERWVCRMLRCPPALVPRSTVQRLFDAAATDGKAGEPSAGQERPQVPGHIEPGMAFWRLVLLVSCYVEVFVAFCPSDGFNARIPLDEFARLAGFLCRWGVPAVSARQASEEAVQLFGRAARWDQLLEWGMERLGEAIQQGGGPFFRHLERVLTGEEDAPRPRPVAIPLALL